MEFIPLIKMRHYLQVNLGVSQQVSLLKRGLFCYQSQKSCTNMKTDTKHEPSAAIHHKPRKINRKVKLKT